MCHQLNKASIATVLFCVGFSVSSNALDIAEKELTQKQFRDAEFAPPLKPDCQPSSGLVVRFIKGAWTYGECLLFSVPKINENMLELQYQVEQELESQILSKANAEALKRYEDRCSIMLSNIRTHELMVFAYAEKNLFFGKTSPVLESHQQTKQDILSQLDRIDERQARLAQKADKSDSLAAAQIRKNDSKHFDRLLKLHTLLWKGSKTYREIVMAINERGQKVSLFDREGGMRFFESQGMDRHRDTLKTWRFEALWDHALVSVVVVEPYVESYPDHFVGSLIAFEMTNGFQDTRFKKIYRLALEGAYDNRSTRDEKLRIEQGAEQFARAAENIENHGKTIHQTIIKEAIEAGLIDDTWFRWGKDSGGPEHTRIYSGLMQTDAGQSHMEYWRNAYKRDFVPSLVKKRKESLSDRMRKLREAQMKQYGA